MDHDQLIVREKHLDDIIEALEEEKRFALRTQDWPRLSEVKRSLSLAKDRQIGVSIKLAVAS